MAWIWGCMWENGASHWADGERCLAGSRRTVKSESAVMKQAAAHERRTGHHGSTWVRKVHGNLKLRD